MKDKQLRKEVADLKYTVEMLEKVVNVLTGKLEELNVINKPDDGWGMMRTVKPSNIELKPLREDVDQILSFLKVEAKVTPAKPSVTKLVKKKK